MEIPTDRLLLMVIVVTGFAVLSGAWISGFAEAHLPVLEAWTVRILAGVSFLGIVAIYWIGFRRIDREHE